MTPSCLRLALTCAAFAGVAAGQTAVQTTPPPPVPATREDAVVLSPFTVTTDRDAGFVGASSLAGGRLASDLKDTAADYSVQTRDFLDALGITDLQEAAQWTVNSMDTGDDGGETAFGNSLSNRMRFRGLASNGQQIDFFPVNYNFDSFSIERIDYARGASGVLFGTGSFSGTPNAVLKRARTDRSFVELRLHGGSWDYYRATVDANFALDRQLAFRVNLLGQNSHTYRQAEFENRRAISFGVTYRPWRNATLNLSADTGKLDKNVASTRWRDFISGWDGKTIFTGAMGARASGGQYPTTNPNPNQAGIQRLGSDTSPYYVILATDPTLSIVNYANTARTMGPGENNNGPNGTGAGGLFPPAGAAAMGLSGADLLNTVGRAANQFDLVIANSNYRPPSRELALLSRTPNGVTTYDTLTLTGSQQFGKHVFLEAAGNYAERILESKLTIANQPAAYLDINRHLNDGRPNPYFLYPYIDPTSGWIRQHNISRNARASAAFVFDRTHLGDFTFNLSGGTSLSTNYRRRSVYSIFDPAVDPRLWPTTNVPRLRFYFNESEFYDDPPTQVSLTSSTMVGTGAAATPVVSTRTVQTGYSTTEGTRSRYDADYVLAALQAKMLKNRLALLFAARRDAFVTTNYNMWGATQRPYELPANWDGVSEYYKPAAPADYAKLTYVPKDANGAPSGPRQNAVARPRAGNGVPLAQYVNDRFQDDYSNPTQDVAGTVYSAGAVLHLTRWASLTGSYGESFNAPSTAARISGLEFEPVLSATTSYGVRFDLPGNRLSLTFSRYTGEQANVAVSSSVGLPTNLIPYAFLNQIINSNRFDDPSADGINQRSISPVPVNFSEIGSRQTEGYEIELVANPLRGLRVSANFAVPYAVLDGGWTETRAYIAQFEPQLKQIVEDSGAIIDSTTNRARSRTAADGPPAAGIDAGNAALGWNSMQDFKRAATGSSVKETRLAQYTANLFLDYTLQTGRLKGLRLGTGVQLRGKSIGGNRGTDTMRDPNNPSAAIDDPTVGSTDYVWADGYYQVTGTLGYDFKLPHNRRMRVDLRVNNLTDFSKPLYNASTQRIVGGDVTNPARRNEVDSAYYLRPRYWELSSTIRF
jgi:outer membrane receptor for ferric coprogen and ferric-rhodotorulic acid